MNNFSQILCQLRKGLDLNQTRIAEIAGVSQPTVQRWFAGTKVPDADDLCRLADYFNVSIDSLLGRAPLNLSEINFAGSPEERLMDLIEAEADRRLEAEKGGQPNRAKPKPRRRASLPTKKSTAS